MSSFDFALGVCFGLILFWVIIIIINKLQKKLSPYQELKKRFETQTSWK
jgi:hypothetical protein